MRQVDVFCSCVQRIKDADLQGLVDLYEAFIGVDPVAVGVPVVSSVLREVLLDYVREECYLAGIHVSEVGL